MIKMKIIDLDYLDEIKPLISDKIIEQKRVSDDTVDFLDIYMGITYFDLLMISQVRAICDTFK